MNTLHVILSLLSISVFFYGLQYLSSRKTNRFLGYLFFGYSILYVLYSIFYIVCYYFTGDGINHAVLYHVRYGLEGAGFLEYKSLILAVTVLLVLCILGVGYLLLKSKNRNIQRLQAGFFLPLLLVMLSGCIHPATVDLYDLLSTEAGEPFWMHYRKPKIQNEVTDKRNFIFIYAESLERTYFDQNIFPELITDLREIESRSISFTNIGGFPNTGWTVAGMVASQCGIPLVSLSHGNSMAGMDTFLSGATCMGDLLSKEGYYLTYMGGASLDFAGKGKLFQSHSFDEVLGRDQLLPLLSDTSYKSNWGLHDDSLFDIAFHKFEELSKADEPFGLFLLTLDTHGSGTHSSASCRDTNYNGKDKMLNVVSCADFLVSDFVQRVQQSPNYGDTIIVIVSDHLAMRNSVYNKLKKGTRRNLFLILDPLREAGTTFHEKGSTLDIGPTVLNSLGFDAQLGLGRNLLRNEASLLKELQHIDSTFASWREEITSFWSFPKVREQIEINENSKSVIIDGRKFRTPVLIRYDDDLQTEMRFQIYNDAPHHKTLIEHLSTFKAEEPFLLVDSCKVLHTKWGNLETTGLCFINGQLGSAEMITETVNGTVILKAKQLKSVAALPVDRDEIYHQRLEKISH